MRRGLKIQGIYVSLALGALAAIALTFLPNGCGDKVALPSDLPTPCYNCATIDTAYVQVNPTWTAADGMPFNRPYDVCIGYDQFVYVCDTKNNRVVKLAEDGTFIESDSVVNPVSITQDRGLDLLVVAGDFFTTKLDTIFTGTGSMRIVLDSTIYGNAIYRKRHFGNAGFQVAWRADSPYYPMPVHSGTFWQEAEFWGIAASTETNKEYFLADFWVGRILKFDSQDRPVTPDLVGPGVGVGMTSYPMDVYFYTIAGKNYLAFAQGHGNLGAQVVSPINGNPLFTISEEGLPPLVRFSSRGPKQIAVDELSNFYVLLKATDPDLGTHHLLYKYDRTGEKLLEFGTEGSGERQFRGPRGLAYNNGILYIADTGNNRIVRYQLATDIQQ
jgi:DNA-binding beta-propeller fold protein YncE